MATVDELGREHRRRQLSLGEIMFGDLWLLWTRILGGRPPRPADVPDLVEVLGPILRQYGQASGALAASTYLRQRDAAGLPAGFDVPTVAPAPTAQIESLFTWVARERPTPGPAGTQAGTVRDRLLQGVNADLRTMPVPAPRGGNSGREPGGNTGTVPAPDAGGNSRGTEPGNAADRDERDALVDAERRPVPTTVPASDPAAAASTATRERSPLDLDDHDAVAAAAARADLAGGAQRVAAQTGRRTIEDAIANDPDAVAWVRITDGNPCGFCAMLASRGAVYLTRDSAKYIEGTRDPYHRKCGCLPSPRLRTDLSPLPPENQRLQDVWYLGPAYFSGDDALNAMRRAMRAIQSGRDPREAVFKGYEHLITHDKATVEEYRRKAQRGGRNGKRDTKHYRPATPDDPGDPRWP